MVILGLGSNIGERAEFLKQAVVALHALLKSIRCSPIYESAAILPEGAPADWNKHYLNMALVGRTTLAPLALLVEVKRIEAALGRQVSGHWGPREIDIDILAYDDQVMHSTTLTLPHKEMLQRDCVIVPVADIMPNWVYPEGKHKGTPARKLAAGREASLTRTDIVIK